MSKEKKKKSLWAITFKDEKHTEPVSLFRNVKQDVFGLDEGLLIYRFTTKKTFSPSIKYNLPRNKNLYKLVKAKGMKVEDFMEEYPEFFF